MQLMLLFEGSRYWRVSTPVMLVDYNKFFRFGPEFEDVAFADKFVSSVDACKRLNIPVHDRYVEMGKGVEAAIKEWGRKFVVGVKLACDVRDKSWRRANEEFVILDRAILDIDDLN
jgi:hypothetical protein